MTHVGVALRLVAFGILVTVLALTISSLCERGGVVLLEYEPPREDVLIKECGNSTGSRALNFRYRHEAGWRTYADAYMNPRCENAPIFCSTLTERCPVNEEVDLPILPFASGGFYLTVANSQGRRDCRDAIKLLKDKYGEVQLRARLVVTYPKQ